MSARYARPATRPDGILPPPGGALRLARVTQTPQGRPALPVRPTSSIAATQAQLAAFWAARGILPAGARWQSLSGGRTNPVWRVTGDGVDAVCKLFDAGAGTPIFANDPDAEATALRALSGTGLAPELIAFAETPAGPSLIYTFLTGPTWTGDPGPVATTLARLHIRQVPPGLPWRDTDPLRLIGETRAMIAEAGPEAAALAGRAPAVAAPGASAPVFLHGDAVPANLIDTPQGPILIDWQCPAAGDPCDDLAVFLSPAMQAVNGCPPLSPEAEEHFLQAYGNAAIAARYRALAPLYHWRMAAYCLWKAARGDAAYADAATLELAKLDPPG